MYTRQEWDRQRELVKRVEKRHGTVLAAVAVPGGLLQLVWGKWADANLDRATRTPINLTIFAIYIVAVGVLMWRHITLVNAVRPQCPQCGVVFKDMPEQVASATGRCEKCGGQVIAS